jgi:hypothetical protein
VTIPDDAYETMLARARRFRRELDGLGISRSLIDANVCARLQSKPAPDLPPGQAELADEVLRLLQDPDLSPWQAHELQRTVLLGA